MKIKALKGGALLALAVGFAIAPSCNVMALEDGTIDYGGNVNQINEQSTTNMLVQATNDGGYVIAGVTGECSNDGGPFESGIMSENSSISELQRGGYFSQCTCGEDNLPKLMSNIDGGKVLKKESQPICGYVVKYKADGTKVWQKDLELADYPSMALTYGYDYDEETGDKIGYDRGYTNVRPIQLKETTAGIGLMTADSDYFLLNAGNGEIVKSYTHIEVVDQSDEDCVESVGDSDEIDLSCADDIYWNTPIWTNVNSDGSTSYLNEDDYIHKKTSAESDQKINYQLTASIPETTQDKVYVIECSAAGKQRATNKSEQGSNIDFFERDDECNLVRLDESFKNRAVIDIPVEGDFGITATSDQLVAVSTYSDHYDEETGDWKLDKAAAYIIKDTSIIAKSELTGDQLPEDPEDMPEEYQAINMFSYLNYFGASDMVETNDGIAVAVYANGHAAVATLDKDLKVTNEIDLDVSSEDANYNDIAFLRDGSITAAGSDVNASEYYDIEGEQNGMHVHYASVITPNQSGTGAPAGVDNPNTLDNTVLFGVGLVALLGTAGCATKRLMHRR